jgi:hypothetical protein
VEVDVGSLASEFPNDNFALHRGTVWVCIETTGPAQPFHAEPLRAEAAEAAEAAEKDASSARSHNTLAPPEDDEEDARTASIVIEELEPVEASLEGDVLDDVAIEAAASPMPEADEVPEAPVPAKSGIVLVGEREVGETRSDDVLASLLEEAAGAARMDSMTPMFEETAASVSPLDSSSLPPASDDPFTLLVCTLTDVAIGAGSPHVASLLPGLLFDGRLPELLDGPTDQALRAAGIWDGAAVTPAFVRVTAAWRSILRGTSDDFDACGPAMLDEWASDLLARLLASPAKAMVLRQELRSRGVAAFGLAA